MPSTLIFFLSLCLSVCLCLYLSLSVCLSVLSVCFFCLSICLPILKLENKGCKNLWVVVKFFCLLLSTSLFIDTCSHLYLPHFPKWKWGRLCFHPFVCLSVCLSFCLFVCLFCLSTTLLKKLLNGFA